MRTAGASNWTSALEDELRAHWESGLSASKIAALMGGGLTRNSVIGKARRMGLEHRRSPVDRSRPRLTPEEAHQRKLERQRGYRRSAATTRPPKVRKPRVPRMPKEAFVPVKPKGQAWEPIPDVTPVSLLELEAGQCRWPVGQDSPHMFCGAPADHGPYCQHHHAWSIGEGTSFERGAVKAAKWATTLERFIPNREAA